MSQPNLEYHLRAGFDAWTGTEEAHGRDDDIATFVSFISSELLSSGNLDNFEDGSESMVEEVRAYTYDSVLHYIRNMANDIALSVSEHIEEYIEEVYS